MTKDLGVAEREQRCQRGATLVEYALLVALVLGSTLVAIDTLTAESADYLSETSDNVGSPRPHYTDLTPHYPDPNFKP